MLGRRRATARGIDPAVERDEVYRVVRSNLLVALADLDRSTVVVTSALPGEGKTATCANLAVALAESGRRVVVADLDLRHPNLHKWFDAPNVTGVSDVLLNRAALEDVLQFVPVGESGAGVYLLPTGPAVPNPSELLGSGRTAKVIDSNQNWAGWGHHIPNCSMPDTFHISGTFRQ